eukprot:c15746_g1_i1.p1 GENE.c15746_g1_i1~~c15746_g1_i1.p1  ORF type:complete len:214 (+),score=50.53 c15746_g1_i1:83-724(+)
MRLSARNLCGGFILTLAVAVFVLSIVLGYLISTEFMVFAFPLFITTLMCGVKCMEPCAAQSHDDESEAEAHHLNLNNPTQLTYGTMHHQDSDDTATSDDDDGDDDGKCDNSDDKPPGSTSSRAKASASGPLALQDWLDSSDAPKPNTTATNNGSPSDNRDDDDSKICIICLDRPREMVFRKCGHMCLCHKCCKRMRRCPICQRKGKAVRVQLV